MFGCLSVGQILQMVRVADKYNLTVGGELLSFPASAATFRDEMP